MTLNKVTVIVTPSAMLQPHDCVTWHIVLWQDTLFYVFQICSLKQQHLRKLTHQHTFHHYARARSLLTILRILKTKFNTEIKYIRLLRHLRTTTIVSSCVTLSVVRCARASFDSHYLVPYCSTQIKTYSNSTSTQVKVTFFFFFCLRRERRALCVCLCVRLWATLHNERLWTGYRFSPVFVLIWHQLFCFCISFFGHHA